jgi:lipopolysaccharide transport protein LptA
MHLDYRRPFAFAMFAICAAGSLLHLQPAIAAERCDTRDWKFSNGPSSYDRNGNAVIQRLELRQCSTLLRASRAEGTGSDSIGNSSWKLTGDVHLEFDGAVLDTQAATVVLRNDRLSSVVVHSAAARGTKEPVRVLFNDATLDVDSATVTFVDGRISTILALGAPAQFSHRGKDGSRAQGRANKLEYDAGKSLVRLSIDTWFSKGSKDFNLDEVTYNLADGSYSSPGSSSGTYRPEERVPAPRTPDRATAK